MKWPHCLVFQMKALSLLSFLFSEVGNEANKSVGAFVTAAIMRVGRWKSVNTLSRYLEKAEHNVWA